MKTKKYRLGPFLGKSTEWGFALYKLLKEIDANPSLNLKQWTNSVFPNLTQRVIEDRIKTVESLAIFDSINGQLIVTDLGKAFIETKNPKILLKTLSEGYIGINEILELLKQKPLTVDSISAMLREDLHCSSKTNLFFTVRLRWLQTFGIVRKTGAFYCLTEEHTNQYVEEKASNCELSHTEIQLRLLQAGKELGYITEKEYKTTAGVIDVAWKNLEEGFPIYAFEIQDKGNLAEALKRLKGVHVLGVQHLILVITNEKNAAAAKQSIRHSFNEISPVIPIVYLNEIEDYVHDYLSLKKKGENTGLHEKRFRKWSKQKLHK